MADRRCPHLRNRHTQSRGIGVHTLRGIGGTLVHRVGPDFGDLGVTAKDVEVESRRELMETLNKQRLNKS